MHLNFIKNFPSTFHACTELHSLQILQERKTYHDQSLGVIIGSVLGVLVTVAMASTVAILAIMCLIKKGTAVSNFYCETLSEYKI